MEGWKGKGGVGWLGVRGGVEGAGGEDGMNEEVGCRLERMVGDGNGLVGVLEW